MASPYAKPQKKKRSVRYVAVQVTNGLLSDKGSLATLLPQAMTQVDSEDQALLQELCFGVARWSHKLSGFVNLLVSKPVRRKDNDINALLQLGLYQLMFMRIPEHAVLNTTVSVATEMGKPWAKGLVNAVLRSFLRERETLEAKLEQTGRQAAIVSFPEWMLEQLKEDWSEEWPVIVAAANDRAPMVIRVNQMHHTRDQCIQTLDNAGILAKAAPVTDTAVVLNEARSVDTLPGFAEGYVSVQDTSAQLAANLLDPRPGERILDACAAPGGKTCHLVELEPSVTVVALDSDRARLDRVLDNCRRLSLTQQVTCVCGDAADPDTWWDGVKFNAILLDAPCSGTGVLRRHPDIKLTRRASDIPELVKLQQKMLTALWPLLEVGGRMLYATCSQLKQENERQIDTFIATQSDAQVISLANHEWGIDRTIGRQILLDSSGMDGFFYALLQKTDDVHQPI